MLRKLLLGVACLGFLTLPQTLRAADEAVATDPAILVRVQSINDLMKSLKYLASFNEDDEQIKQALSLIKDLIDEKKGLEGIDVSKPIGLYANLKEEVTESPAVLLIPIADKETFLTFLKERANLTIKEGKDGVYETQPEGFPMTVYFRFANGYVYGTFNDSANIKKLPLPEKVLVGKPEELISVTFRVDRLPEQMKKAALGAVEGALVEAKKQPIPNATKSIEDFRDMTVDKVSEIIKSLLDNTEGISLKVAIDPKKEEFALELDMTAKKGSELAKDYARIKENKSPVAGVIDSLGVPAGMIHLNIAMPESLRKKFGPVIDDAWAEAKKEIPGEIQEIAEPLVKSLLPTVKQAELDLGTVLVGPNKDGKYTLVAAVKVNEGKKIEAAIRDANKKLPPDVTKILKVDAEKLKDGTFLHLVKNPNPEDPNLTKVFGKSDAYIAFRDDLMLITFGVDAKNLITKSLESKPASGGVLTFDISLGRIVPLVGETAEQAAKAKEIANKVFGKEPKADHIRMSIEGGTSFKVRLSAQGKAISFMSQLGAEGVVDKK